MSVVHSINNVQHALQALKEKIDPDQWADTPLPIIAAPQWWLNDVCKELGAPMGEVPDTIHNCTVLRRDELPEPVLINHDGKAYPILPQWQRAKTVAINDSQPGAEA